MTENPIHLAVDAGQSSTRLRYRGGGHDRLVVLPGVDTGATLTGQLAERVQAALAEQPDAAVHTVAIGTSGLGRETAHDVLALLDDTGVRRVILAHDSVTSYLGALGDGEGCVIAAGTGTICLAVGPRHTARVDGWGHLLGDAGSAYWIGRTGLEAALRGYDGRRQMTALTGAMADLFPDIELAYLDLQAAPDRVARIAAFAGIVSELAASDRVAANILDKAAAHLSEAVQAAVRRVHLNGPRTPRVAVLGGVFRSEQVLRRFVDYLSLQWPSFAITEPAGEGLDGAQALLGLDQHPLSAHLSVAER